MQSGVFHKLTCHSYCGLLRVFVQMPIQAPSFPHAASSHHRWLEEWELGAITAGGTRSLPGFANSFR
jgi:hypothetical protein